MKAAVPTFGRGGGVVGQGVFEQHATDRHGLVCHRSEEQTAARVG